MELSTVSVTPSGAVAPGFMAPPAILSAGHSPALAATTDAAIAAAARPAIARARKDACLDIRMLRIESVSFRLVRPQSPRLRRRWRECRGRGARLGAAGHGVDVDDDDVGAVATVDQGKQGGIAHVAAVPIAFAVDLDRLEQERQAGGSEDMIGRELPALEHPDLAGADVGRRGAQLGCAGGPP